MRKMKEIIRTEMILFTRDFFGLFFTFLFPVLMLILYGSIYGNEPSEWFGGLGTMDVSVPAYSAMIIGVTGLMAFPLTIAGYRENQIYKRFDATPAGKGMIMTAQALVNFFMTVAGFLLLFLTGKLVYHIRVMGSPLAIALALLLSIAAIFSLGFFFTAVSPNAKISNLLCYISYFVMIFLSGATLPAEMFPEGIKKLSLFLPLTHVVKVLQGTFRGAEFARYQTSVLVLVCVLAVCLTAGAVCYRKKSWI